MRSRSSAHFVAASLIVLAILVAVTRGGVTAAQAPTITMSRTGVPWASFGPPKLLLDLSDTSIVIEVQRNGEVVTLDQARLFQLLKDGAGPLRPLPPSILDFGSSTPRFFYPTMPPSCSDRRPHHRRRGRR